MGQHPKVIGAMVETASRSLRLALARLFVSIL